MIPSLKVSGSSKNIKDLDGTWNLLGIAVTNP